MDLIDRQAAIDAIERNAYRHTYIDQIVDIIKELPSAQPQPIVRCKDCMHADDDGVCQNSVGLVIQDDDDFCSKAERRPDGN